MSIIKTNQNEIQFLHIVKKKRTEKIKCEHSRKLSDFLSNSKTLEY